jgi:phage anti-repressor protein
MIKPTSINFKELVRNSNTTLSLDLQSKIVDKLNETFSEQEQHWYVANLYMYMNYHPTDDYPINLEHVFKMIGFANKGNAMKTIKSNFVENEDYKIIIFRTEKNKLEQETRGRKEETVMLNIDTFKNLCMIVKTESGKEIRRYYVKLENIYNEIIKEELEQQKTILQEKQKELEENRKELREKDKKINLLEHKPETHGFDMRKSGFVYLINDLSKPGHYKIGMASNSEKRLRNLNTSSSEKSFIFSN